MSQTDEPVYSHGDRQIARILHRAAELQEKDTERRGVSLERADGLSLTDLKQIAGEVGIDPRYVEAAAIELREAGEGPSGFYFWGAPGSSTLERVAQGEVSPDEWEALVARIREITGRVGKPSSLGRSLEWVSQIDHVSVSPKNGRTFLRVLTRYDDLMVRAHMPALLGAALLDAMIAAGLHSAPLEAVGLGIAVAGGAFALARRWTALLVHSHRRKMQSLLQELAAQVEGAAPQVDIQHANLAAGGSEKASVPTDAPLTVSRPTDV